MAFVWVLRLDVGLSLYANENNEWCLVTVRPAGPGSTSYPLIMTCHKAEDSHVMHGKSLIIYRWPDEGIAGSPRQNYLTKQYFFSKLLGDVSWPEQIAEPNWFCKYATNQMLYDFYEKGLCMFALVLREAWRQIISKFHQSGHLPWSYCYYHHGDLVSYFDITSMFDMMEGLYRGSVVYTDYLYW